MRVNYLLAVTLIVGEAVLRLNPYNRKQVLDVLVSFMQATGMSATRLGYLALGDPTFVGKFRRGALDPRLSTLFRLVEFIRKNRRKSKQG